MNLKVELFLYVDDEEYGPEEITRLAMGLSDFVVQNGYGNEADEKVEDTTLKSVLIVKPSSGRQWEKSADGKVMVVSFPTNDEDFLRQAESGGIKGIG